MSVSSLRQWQISLFAGFLFLIVCLPQTYEFTGKVYHKITGSHISGMNHLWLHVAVFVLLTKWSMTWRFF